MYVKLKNVDLRLNGHPTTHSKAIMENLNEIDKSFKPNDLTSEHNREIGEIRSMKLNNYNVLTL